MAPMLANQQETTLMNMRANTAQPAYGILIEELRGPVTARLDRKSVV